MEKELKGCELPVKPTTDDCNYVAIRKDFAQRLQYLGILPDPDNPHSNCRDHNVGDSNYHIQIIQPWTIWLAYPNLDAFDKDIIKRVLRDKASDSRENDYIKIIHICEEKLRQLKYLDFC